MTKKEPPGKRVPNGEDGVQEGEIPDLLNIIFNHRKAALQGFLRDRRQAFSGTQEKLRERVEGYLSDGSVRAEELVELLDRIEGWGNQHIYLYRAPDVLIEALEQRKEGPRRPEGARQGTPAQQTTTAGATGEPPAMRR